MTRCLCWVRRLHSIMERECRRWSSKLFLVMRELLMLAYRFDGLDVASADAVTDTRLPRDCWIDLARKE